MGCRRWMESVMRGRDGSAAGSAVRAVLGASAVPYGWAVRWRNRRFDRAARKVVRLPRTTISVGNLTTGGTGKTPMVIALSQILREMGHVPGVLLRGYGAEAAQPSDEQALFVDTLGADAVQADPDRVRGAQRLLQRNPQVDVLLLDDGFQHRRAWRDLDLVLIDATDPWGGGHLLPRGFMREPRTGLRRAHAVILTRCDQVGDEALGELESEIRAIAPEMPIMRTRHRWTGFRLDASSGASSGQKQELAIAEMPRGEQGRWTAISAIGNPDAWARTLAAHGIDVRRHVTLQDHHAYTRGELSQWFRDARLAGDLGVLTTEKDFVKWRGLLGEIPASDRVDVVRPQLTIDWISGREAIMAMLKQVAG